MANVHSGIGRPELEMHSEVINRIELKNSLDSIGYYHFQEEISFSQFEKKCHSLGDVILRKSVKLENDSSPIKNYISSDLPAPFHTDGLDTHYVSWYCIDPGHDNEETLLIDVRRILSYFTEEEKELLKRIKFFKLNAGSFPILRSENPIDFYFVPSQICKSKKYSTNLALLKKMIHIIDEVSSTNLIRIKYKKNQCLFINNKMFLHGRHKLDSQTTRHLERFWIQKNEKNSQF